MSNTRIAYRGTKGPEPEPKSPGESRGDGDSDVRAVASEASTPTQSLRLPQPPPDLGPDGLKRYARIFKALSSPHRLRIFMSLAVTDRPEGGLPPVKTVGEIGEALDLAPSTVSHHLKELHVAGVIRMERKGQRIECRVEADALTKLASFLS